MGTINSNSGFAMVLWSTDGLVTDTYMRHSAKAS